MSAHTPGPWEAVRDLVERWHVVGDFRDDPEGVPVADVRNTEARANAHLIAAAPDLYEALLALRTREAPDCWCPSAHKHGRAIAADEHTNECTMTSAALAKADGKP